MSAAPDPREVSALLRYASPDYFGAMRDVFADCAAAADAALAAFAGGPAPRPHPLDADAATIWTHCVAPNLRWTLARLDAGYAALTHGRADGAGAAANVTTTLAAIARDHGTGWMDPPARGRFATASERAWRMARNIHRTFHADWQPGELVRRCLDGERGLLAGAAAWAACRIDTAVRVGSGDVVPASGVYVPEHAGSAQLLVGGRRAPPLLRAQAGAGIRPAAERGVATVWTRVERVAASGG